MAARILLDAGVDGEMVQSHVLVALAGGTSQPTEPRRVRGALQARLHAIDAVLAAWERRAELLDLLTGVATREEARRQVAARLGVDEEAAERILDLRLGQLSLEEGRRLREERGRLRRALEDQPD